MAEGGENADLVADILARPFSRRTFQEKQDLVKGGRPTPVLANLSQAGKGLSAASSQATTAVPLAYGF